MTARPLIPQLPRQAWVLLAGDAFSALGTGMILPFTIIYLHRVRGIEIEYAGVALSMMAVAGVVAGPLAGSIIDRVGPRRVLVVALIVSALGSLAFLPVRTTGQAFIATAIAGAGMAAFWPSIQSLLSNAVEPHQRSAVFSVHYATLNLGIGIGGIAGGLILDISSARSFEALYIVDALTFVPPIVILLLVLREIGGAPVRESAEQVSPRGGYADVFKDRVFVRVWLLMVLLVTVGYSQLESGLPAFATGEAGVGTTTVGLAFAANTFFIVGAQLFVLKMVEGHRRTRSIAMLGCSWAVCWMVTYFVGSVGGWAAHAGIIGGMVFFAAGETLLSPTLPAIVNDLAPEAFRGRYNAVYALAWSAGSFFGPALAGWFLGARLAGPFFVALSLASIGAAAFALSLEKRLPAGANLVTSDAEVSLA